MVTPQGRLSLLFFFLLACAPPPSWALRPMSNNLALVAGEGTAGFRDGPFTAAFFKAPTGLALSQDGKSLFVADSANNRIRVVLLNRDNAVTTLAGHDLPGGQNGDLAHAAFNAPQGLVVLPDDRLVVNDFGNGLLRLVDLKSGTVTTLGGGAPTTLGEGPASQISMAGIWDMTYLPKADSLFFTQPELKTLKRLDLKTGQVSYVLNGRAGLTHPGALCGDGDSLYIADRDDPQVDRLDWKMEGATELVPVATIPGNVLALAVIGAELYCLQNYLKSPLMRLLPNPEPVTFVSVWGDRLPDPGDYLPSFTRMKPKDPIGFIPDPSSPRKFFLANPGNNIITSFRDLTGNADAGGDYRGSNGLNDFEYPLKKPPGTYRILLVGDSRSCMVVGYSFDADFNVKNRERYPRQIGMSKRMELELNQLAALEDAPLNFEVLNLAHSASFPLFLWPLYEVPEAVQKNDIDLVLFLQPPNPNHFNPFQVYFERPLTAEGVPSAADDPEYLMLAPSKRIPEGEPKDFYNLCKSRHWVHQVDNNLVFDDNLILKPETHEVLTRLYGKPLELLNRRLSAMKTSSGEPVRFLFCFSPTGYFEPSSVEGEFWRDLTQRFTIPFLDLSHEMTSLKISFYPMTEFGGNSHFNIDGHLFFGRLMAHTLIYKGLIPWSAVSRPAYSPASPPP